ncbi:hypothetical protein HQ865_00810 [Mucilaginibacter mali]|uniref:YubB ferredoxin-like domain-containing protein n=1 Tax=Mucilaginibacter mali TaxID=2740462 RepID=A0A7D4UBQ4_9SPHI|nr:hypothetical protein [Mucilaginibacter mali]QKJ28359.1 hypothetical protein HQ865_00810 [Mucilaginibacter mali]
MPNWCANSVVFFAAEDRLGMIRDLFTDIQQKQEVDGRYHLPDFAVSEGFMRDIVLEPGCITFTTRSSPNISLLAEIADHYDAAFVNRYMEIGDGLYGEARYDFYMLTITDLDQEELRAAICYDPQKRDYPYGEQVFEYEGDLLDHILDQKIAQKSDTDIYQRLR